MASSGSVSVKAPKGSRADTHRGQLARLQAQVDSLRDQLAQAERLAAVGTMTAMVAHEFNNILTPIINYAKMARKNPALVDKALERAAAGGERATDICHALLGVVCDAPAQSRIRSLAEIAAQTLSAMARDPAKDRIDLRVDIPGELKITKSDCQLQQVLLNLLINARTAVLASQGPRRIEISASDASDAIVLRVADNGVGIPAANLEKIFQPFFSTKAQTGDGSPGYGLGLAFCRKVMTDLGGDISVESAPGRGATFFLRIPH